MTTPTPTPEAMDRTAALLRDLEGYIEYCGNRFSDRVRVRADVARIAADALHRARAEALEEAANLVSQRYHRAVAQRDAERAGKFHKLAEMWNAVAIELTLIESAIRALIQPAPETKG